MAAERIANMTKAELREFIRETVRELLDEYVDLSDPDAGLEFRPEVAEYLQKVLRGEEGLTFSAEDVRHELGLDE
jgi:hypothetical protein